MYTLKPNTMYISQDAFEEYLEHVIITVVNKTLTFSKCQLL